MTISLRSCLGKPCIGKWVRLDTSDKGRYYNHKDVSISKQICIPKASQEVHNK